MTIDNSRRTALLGFGSLAVGAAALAARPSRAATTEQIIPPGARELAELMERLRRAPRRRDFKTVPMILEHPDFWDDEALKEIIAYRGTRKQVWDNTDIGEPLAEPDAQFGQCAGLLLRASRIFSRSPPRTAPLISRCSTRRCGTNTSSPRLPAPNSRPTR